MHHLDNLRKNINIQKVDAYLQPVHDAYMSEYPPACNRRVEWLTGFSGSAGMVAVTADKAALFTDGRYTLQAQQQVDRALYEQHNSGTLTAEAWLAQVLPEGSRVGYDAMLFTRDMLARMGKVLEPKGIRLVAVDNAVDAIWKDRPAAPASAVFAHDIGYAGVESVEKRAQVAGALADTGADALLITAPEAVCWLLNIRARDVQNTPLLLAVALVDAHGHVELFVEPERVGAELREHLGEQVQLVAPQGLRARLELLKGKRVQCDPAQ
ncbi:MAG: aminopeptidase P family protein, partial [Proteobacteria bacterium]|nr:aminopeptidase P family protein [Pseudomonadota bacterium]